MNTLLALAIRRIRPPLPSRRIAERLPDYLRSVAAPMIGIDGNSIELEKVDTGTVTVVRGWPTREHGVLYVRAWPSDPAECPARGHAEAAHLFFEAGLRVPKVLHADDSHATRFRWRFEVVIETEAPGEPFNDRRAEHARLMPRIAVELAHLHSGFSTDWGRIWRDNDELSDPRAYWASRIRKLRDRIVPGSCGLSEEQIREGIDRLERRIAELKLDKPALLHGDIVRTHVRVGQAGEITWIDFGRVHCGMPELDLSAVRLALCPEDFPKFLEFYSGNLKGRSIDIEAIHTFAQLTLWERLYSRIRRQSRRRAKQAKPGSLDEKLVHDQAWIEDWLARDVRDFVTLPGKLTH